MSATPATSTAPVYFDLRDRTLAERWKAWQPVPGQPVSLRGFDAARRSNRPGGMPFAVVAR